MDARAVPVRQYLEATVVPTLMQARSPVLLTCQPGTLLIVRQSNTQLTHYAAAAGTRAPG